MTARAPRLCALAALCAGAACVLPDLEIDVEDEQITNRNAVHIVEPVLLLEAAHDGCPESFCQQPYLRPDNALPYFLAPETYPFCSCGPNETSAKTLSSFKLFVEDRDEEPRSRTPKDDLFAAFFIDLAPSDPRPPSKQAFQGRVIPDDEPLDLAEEDYNPFLRSEPHLRQLPVGEYEIPLDPCNHADDQPLPVGFHTLKIMVTDRPWYKAKNIPQVGVPDLARGATFDSVTYVFYCLDGKSDENAERCLCSADDLGY